MLNTANTKSSAPRKKRISIFVLSLEVYFVKWWKLWMTKWDFSKHSSGLAFNQFSRTYLGALRGLGETSSTIWVQTFICSELSVGKKKMRRNQQEGVSSKENLKLPSSTSFKTQRVGLKDHYWSETRCTSTPSIQISPNACESIETDHNYKLPRDCVLTLQTSVVTIFCVQVHIQ